MWQQVAHNVHGINEEFAIFNANMYMCAEDQQPLGKFLHVLLDTHIAFLWGDLLRHPGGKWVSACCHDL